MSWEKELDEILSKTEGEVFEKATLQSLWKLMSKGHISSFDFPISTGKEGNVFRAKKGDEFVAVKIYRINTSTFRNISKYLMYDSLYKVKKDRRSIIFAWAKKEFNTLKKLYDAGVRVPRPIANEGNVIVMEYIGDAIQAAPLLKDAAIDNAEKIFCKLAHYLRLMYRMGIVHADFSEYNVLIHNGEPVIIDVGQTVGSDNPMAMDFLRRDVKNITRFFRKYISIDEDTLFKYIVGEKDEIC